jgi:MFS family permease
MIARMRNRTSASDAPTADPVPTDRLADWVSADIITQEQADRIAAHELSQAARRQTAPAANTSLLVEALGYVGGVIILVGAVLLATEFWDELGVPGRLAVVGGAAAVMVVAGLAVPQRAGEQGRRLRAVLWAAATGAFAGFMGLLSSDVLGLFGDDSGLLTSAATAAVAVLLWWLRPTNLQHLVAAVALAATVATALAKISDAEYLPGTGIWAVGLVWFLLALGGVLRPRRFALTLGSAVAIVGALLLMVMSDDAGIALTLASAAAVVAMAVVMTDLTLLAVGAVGLLFALPTAVSTWFGGTFAAPIALLGAGVLLVVAALWIARRRHRPDDDAEAPATAPLET